MPRLKELTIQGFKSFADPITLIYPTGITAIVGPNGSGKSNIADAIRWVLGEQRMRALRGHSGEDMVFAGSKKRSRAGMARVALTFDNHDNWLPLDFAEVTIERRTYRDGKTEYMLNGSKLRLMDLSDLLDRAGLGRDAYLTIGQGLVDEVLSLRPQERLALFEQAAGISPYRNRREESLKRLEETHHNLERVQDIIGEIEPRLHRLEKEVSRAEQLDKLNVDLKGLLEIWYGYRWHRALHELEFTRQRALYHEKRVQERQEAIDALIRQGGELRQTMGQLRTQLAELHREGSIRHGEAEAIQRELAVSRERRRLLQERHEESSANLIPLQTALQAEESEIAELEAALQQGLTRLTEAQSQLAAVEQDYQKVEAQRHALLSRQSGAQSRALESRHQLTDRQSRLEQQQERAGQLTERANQIKKSMTAATEHRRTQQEAVEAARQAVEQIEAQLTHLESAIEQQRAAQEAARSDSERLRREVADKQAARQQLAARLEALERLHAEGTGLYAGVQAVLQAAEHGKLHGLPGTFASLIHVPSELERAIETALGAQVQDIVARRWEDARDAVQWLKQQRAGRATFLPLDNLSPSRPLEITPGQGIVGLAADLVRYDDAALRPAVQLLLGRVAVAENLEAARELYRTLRDKSGGFQIVTLEGEILRSGGSVTGGEERREQRGGSLLARERERRDLPEQVQALEQEIKALQEEFQHSEGQGRALAEKADALVAQRRTTEQKRLEATRQLEAAVRALEKLIQESDWQRQLLEESGQEQERLKATQQRLEQEKQAAEQSLAQAEAEAKELAQALDALSDDTLGQTVASHRTQVAISTQECDNHRVLLETRKREARRLGEQIQGQAVRIRTLKEELETLERQLQGLQGRYETARAAAEALSGQIPPLEQQVAALETDQGAQESKETELRHVLRDAEQQFSKSEIEVRHREDQVQALRQEIEEALEIVIADLPDTLAMQQPLPLATIAPPLPVVPELPDGLEQQVHDLRTQIRRIGPVNETAREEYNEVAERHHFLREQSADLETASAHLRQIIAELDELMKTAFNTTFKAINSEFGHIFKLLFNGGNADLTPVTNEAGETLGVDIIARPPGKRASSLGMLSGGERTLTAVALLFAVLRVSPTPFCILDEVDAMLDEANVGRFRAMLQELGKQTQFLTITHNRGTVEAADTIYGVSMGEDGVSQVLSLSLEDLPASEVV